MKLQEYQTRRNSILSEYAYSMEVRVKKFDELMQELIRLGGIDD